MPQSEKILSTLNQTSLQRTDPKLYQTLQQLITNLQKAESDLQAATAKLSAGVNAQITTASLVGKTITVTNGIITSFV